MDYRSVSKSKFRFSKLKKYDKEAFCNIIYGAETLVIESPVLSAATKVIRNKSKTYIVLEADKSSKDFFDFMKMVDHICINMTAKNSKKWFQGRKVTKSMIENAYKSPCIKEDPSLIRILLGGVNRIYNHRSEKIPSTNIKVGSKLKCILQLSGLWATGNFIGVHWEIVEISLLSKEKPTVRRSKLKTSRRSSEEDEEYMKFRQRFAEKYQNESNESNEASASEASEDIIESVESEDIIEASESEEDVEEEDVEEDSEVEYAKYKRKLKEAREYMAKYKDDDSEDSIERRRSYETDSEEEELEILRKKPRRRHKEMKMDFSRLIYGKRRNLKNDEYEGNDKDSNKSAGVSMNETNSDIKKVNF